MYTHIRIVRCCLKLTIQRTRPFPFPFLFDTSTSIVSLISLEAPRRVLHYYAGLYNIWHAHGIRTREKSLCIRVSIFFFPFSALPYFADSPLCWTLYSVIMRISIDWSVMHKRFLVIRTFFNSFSALKKKKWINKRWEMWRRQILSIEHKLTWQDSTGIRAMNTPVW